MESEGTALKNSGSNLINETKHLMNQRNVAKLKRKG